MQPTVTIREPSQGLRPAIAYLLNIWQLRHFWLALVRNDLRTRYRRSVIGIGWSLLHPIAMTTVLCTIFCQIFNQDVREYAPYLLTGLTFWTFITTSIGGGCQSFFQGESYIRQHPAPLAIYPLRTVLGAGFHFLLGLLVSLVFIWAVNGFDNLPALVSLVPTLMLLFVFGWSLAICTGTLNVLFQDCQHLVEVFLQVMFYLTPIMYPASMMQGPRMKLLVQLNPLAAFVELIRQPMLFGQLPSSTFVISATIATLVTATIAIFAMWWSQRRMIFYL